MVCWKISDPLKQKSFDIFKKMDKLKFEQLYDILSITIDRVHYILHDVFLL